MNTGSRLIVYYITESGGEVAARLKALYPEAECIKYRTGAVEADWPSARAMVFIMASGIAVRSIAPLLGGKHLDPAVVLMDEKGKYAVSLLGGHESGANDIAREISEALGAEPVITTSTDINDLTSIDVFAKDHGLAIENRNLLSKISARHIKNKTLMIFNETGIKLPDDYSSVDEAAGADVVISNRLIESKALVLRPRDLVLGFGCNLGTGAEEISEAIDVMLKEKGFSRLSLSLIATHDKKKSEPGLKEFARGAGLDIVGYTTEELNSVTGVAESKAARKALGVVAVSEPSALMAAHAGELLVHKVKSGNLTLALAASQMHRLYVVGTGPGGLEHITPGALNAIREAEVVVGFKSYLKLIEPLLKGKEIVSSAMTQEVDRVRRAVEMAMEGRKVALVSGGDPGVYAMAGLVYEVVKSMDAPIDVRVVPGLSALNACGARLGAPLMHDFCAISLSDRLTPWEQIERRLMAAAEADFVVVLYNPKSMGRKTQIERAREILLRHRKPTTPVGIVRAAMREDEDVVITTLEDMLTHEIDMKCTVTIGNSKSFRWRDRLITPRGYGNKYEI